MATIIENLKKILEARYGKDVRQAIHDSIENCYNDGKAGSIDLQARHDIEEIGTKIETVESIAKGKNQARVFSTTEAMENWLSDSANKGVANVGDNLYIVAVDVPDWWISSVLEAPNESGMYYEIAQLETQKVDLTTIESAINSIDSKIGSTDISAIGDGTVTGGLDALNSNFNKIPHSIKVASGYSAYASITRQNCWRTKDFLYLNLVLTITNYNSIEQHMALIELNLHAHGMNDILAFSSEYKLMEFYTSNTSLCVNIAPTDNMYYFITGVIPINSL